MRSWESFKEAINSFDPASWLVHKAGEEVKSKMTDAFMGFFIDYLSVLPIITVVGGAVYILFRIFSKTLAKWGVIGVCIYGGLIVLFA